MIDSSAAKIINRMEPIEKNMLQLIADKGRLSRGFFNNPDNKKFREALKKCKARSLVTTSGSWHDLTDFGTEVLKIIGKMGATPGKSEQITPSNDDENR